jgi:type I restriction enzyme R subunit
MALSKEVHFEDEVFDALVSSGGWVEGDPHGLDFALGINPTEALAFVTDTQAEEWASFLEQQGGAEDLAEVAFLKELTKQLDRRGTVDVLRNGVKGWGRRFRLCSFKPAHGLTPELVDAYEANRLTVTRQQRYNAAHTNTLDLCLWVNGLPVATLELKNELTGQTVRDAEEQYRSTARDPKDLFLSRRAVVHFAVDPYLVSMTTRLAGGTTRFLPFNQGHNKRQGNPPASPGKHRTAYLWEQVFQRDAWLDIFGRFVLTVKPDDKVLKAEPKARPTVIFPRYHQWDCVLRLTADAKAKGPGQMYLAQHSAGSGKSNSIAWLAHRLSSLHNDADEPVFDKVVVITDRIVLDNQLQETISQVEHVSGVVERVDATEGAKSTKLAEALMGAQARIVICTLQTFSHVLDKVEGLGSRKYAVIVDEAHSSQTGEAAKDLKLVLGDKAEEVRLANAEKVEGGDPITSEDRLNEAVAARAAQGNLSFFAFTATPKPRTVELFGSPVPGQDLKEPFHLYSMRQAIEEKFILDVLTGYTTFDVFWRVSQAAGKDPEVVKSKASAEIAKAVSLHPHNLNRRARIIVDHFRQHVAHQIGGHAKAMVVTASRLHAVRYKQALDAYLLKEHITDVRTVVAFSGKVEDPDEPQGDPFTEPGLNGFPLSETAGRFKGEPSPPFDVDDYQVLIVAEKFQTGFDAPLLHTMYVDKKLEGVNAVQTLARLNRTAPGKESTFVLDFRNSVDAIQDAFRDFYDATLIEPADANLLYAFQDNLVGTGIVVDSEIDSYWAAFSQVAPNQRKGNGALYSNLDPALERFKQLDEDDQEAVRAHLDAYVRAYSFLAQIVTWTDGDLEKLYVFAKSLRAVLPPRADDGGVSLGSEIELTHLRFEMADQVDGSIASEEDSSEPGEGFTGGASPRHGDPEKARLSEIVERLNDKYAQGLTITDALLFEQFKGDWAQDPELAEAAKANDLDNFMLVFVSKFFDTVFARMDANEAIFKAINDDDHFADELKTIYGREVYRALRADDETH